MITILIHPGWQDSGPEHWQSRWLKKYSNAIRVEQEDWMNPKKDNWVATLEKYVQGNENIVLVGHSLACPLFAHWAKENKESARKIKGALLVAPADADQENFPKEIVGFSPIPLDSLPFPSIVVTSENDPWVSLERAKHFAQSWGSQFVNIGFYGHINAASGLGDWPEGEALLQRLAH